MFRKVKINISLFSVINHIPAYVRFLEGLCTKNMKFKDRDQKVISRESSIFHKSLLPKLDDHICFTVPCNKIGDLIVL